MKTWRILYEDGYEVYYRGTCRGAVDYAIRGYIGYKYTIEEWEVEE